jgi:hypothetical protein
MTFEPIRIGSDLPANTARLIPPRNRAVTYLPTKLDAAACLAVLKRIDPDVKTDSIAAARETIDVHQLDDALETSTQLSISDRFRFKAALSEHGILSLGKRS